MAIVYRYRRQISKGYLNPGPENVVLCAVAACGHESRGKRAAAVSRIRRLKLAAVWLMHYVCAGTWNSHSFLMQFHVGWKRGREIGLQGTMTDRPRPGAGGTTLARKVKHCDSSSHKNSLCGTWVFPEISIICIVFLSQSLPQDVDYRKKKLQNLFSEKRAHNKSQCW